jgi:8-oxo-dGTP pyrophosphatase MutT (NUDIX family)
LTDLDQLRRQLARITPVEEREKSSLARTLERLTWPGDPFDEHFSDHHLTASAFVISSRGVILHRHKRLGIWVQPGGHVDPGETPEEAALRETIEETGLIVRHLDPVELFNVDVHPGPRGHTHYDLRYVLVAPPVEPAPPVGESPDVYWFTFDAAVERCESSLVATLTKLGESIAGFDVKE